jgi:DNA mismatch endonuclease (patch repair protein)
MPDKFAPEVRSRMMASIRSKGNKETELRLRMILVRAGIKGWRVQAEDLPGRPDFAFDAERVAVFVDGCFWHGCPRCYRRPQSAQEYWDEKIAGNRRRDQRHRRKLNRMGWSVVRIWACSLANGTVVGRRVHKALSGKNSRGGMNHGDRNGKRGG